MTTKSIGDWLDATLTSDLSVTCRKGNPAFARTDIAAGAYIEWTTTEPVGRRVSSTIDGWNVAFDVTVVTSNEVALWAMLDLIETMAETRTEASIGGVRYRVSLQNIGRAENPLDVDAMRYAVSTTITFAR